MRNQQYQTISLEDISIQLFHARYILFKIVRARWNVAIDEVLDVFDENLTKIQENVFELFFQTKKVGLFVVKKQSAFKNNNVGQNSCSTCKTSIFESFPELYLNENLIVESLSNDLTQYILDQTTVHCNGKNFLANYKKTNFLSEKERLIAMKMIKNHLLSKKPDHNTSDRILWAKATVKIFPFLADKRTPQSLGYVSFIIDLFFNVVRTMTHKMVIPTHFDQQKIENVTQYCESLCHLLRLATEVYIISYIYG
jgi:hypothetical protein